MRVGCDHWKPSALSRAPNEPTAVMISSSSTRPPGHPGMRDCAA